MISWFEQALRNVVYDDRRGGYLHGGHRPLTATDPRGWWCRPGSSFSEKKKKARVLKRGRTTLYARTHARR